MKLESKEYIFLSIRSVKPFNNFVKFTQLEENKWKIEIKYDFYLKNNEELIINLNDLQVDNKVEKEIEKFFNDRESDYDRIFFGYTGLLVRKAFEYLASETINKDIFYQKLDEIFKLQRAFVEEYCNFCL